MPKPKLRGAARLPVLPDDSEILTADLEEGDEPDGDNGHNRWNQCVSRENKAHRVPGCSNEAFLRDVHACTVKDFHLLARSAASMMAALVDGMEMSDMRAITAIARWYS
jgi:hypothetical protein